MSVLTATLRIVTLSHNNNVLVFAIETTVFVYVNYIFEYIGDRFPSPGPLASINISICITNDFTEFFDVVDSHRKERLWSTDYDTPPGMWIDVSAVLEFEYSIKVVEKLV